jgi:hypothetical protein
MALTVEVTSMPLPEVLVAEFKTALTAVWIADEAVDPELELSVPDVDALSSKLAKLDRIELMLLVLMFTPPASFGHVPLRGRMPCQLWHRQIQGLA